jgi:PelA/Pel-15E family pectate lyase
MHFKTTLIAALLGSCCLLPACAEISSPSATHNAQSSTTAEWQHYLATSEKNRALDRTYLSAELKKLGQQKPTLPEHTKEFGFDIKQSSAWFNSAEGKRIMDIILSFQTPSGGWSKRTDMASAPRQPGQAFGVEKDYIPTFDNGATSTQLKLLAQAHQATGDTRYSDAFGRGLQLILTAQYPNGGWPQNYPLVGKYHDLITYNDGLMYYLMVILHDVANAQNEYSFVTEAQQQAAQASLKRALDCVLQTQVVVNGTRTIWGAQYDVKTLKPAKARAFEMVSLTSAESVAMLDFLMTLENPSPDIINAAHAAAAWYEQHKIVGKIWVRGESELKDAKDTAPLWARFYEIGTNKPIFGDRDNSVHYDLGEVSEERRAGYAWYTTSPNKVLKRYARWAKKYPR